MKTVSVDILEQKNKYNVYIGNGILDNLQEYLKHYKNKNILLISNDKIFPIYKELLEDQLKKGDFRYSTLLLPDGEENKTLFYVEKIISEALDKGFGRDGVFLGFGGGVIGDIVGFAAAIYMRGIEVIHIPTTLLAQVDSSVGGKTAVNHFKGKNLIGSFHHPSFVICDIDLFETLSEEDFLSGLGEVVKYGVIYDRAFFNYLSKNTEKILDKDKDVLTNVVYRCVEIKAEVVSKDNKEKDLRRILNFGHTFGHSLEKATEYRISHGKAVSIGMVAAGNLALEMGLWESNEMSMLLEILNKLKLPVSYKVDGFDKKTLFKNIFHDKKVKDGKLNFVLPTKIGQVGIYSDIPEDKIKKALNSILI